MKKHTEAHQKLLSRSKSRQRVDYAVLRLTAKKLRGLRHEGHFNQGRWVEDTECGTAACIAGHICLIKGMTPEEIYSVAYLGTVGMTHLLSKELGLPSRVCDELFHSTSRFWPEPYKTDFANAVIAYQQWKFRFRRKPFKGKRPSRVAADFLDAIAAKKVRFDDYGFTEEGE